MSPSIAPGRTGEKSCSSSSAAAGAERGGRVAALGCAVLHPHPSALTNLESKAGAYLSAHRSTLVSEALSNASKHANASAVHIRIDASQGAVRMSIQDNGVGGANGIR